VDILYSWRFHCFAWQRVLLQEDGIVCICLIKHRAVKAFGKVEVLFHAFITSTLKVCGSYMPWLSARREWTPSAHCIGRLGWPQDLVRTLWSKTSPCREANHLPDRSLVTALSWLCCVLLQTYNNCGLYAYCLSKISSFTTSDVEFLGDFHIVFEEFIENTLYVVHLTICTSLGDADSKRVTNRIYPNPVNGDETAILMHENPPVPVLTSIPI